MFSEHTCQGDLFLCCNSFQTVEKADLNGCTAFSLSYRNCKTQCQRVLRRRNTLDCFETKLNTFLFKKAIYFG